MYRVWIVVVILICSGQTHADLDYVKKVEEYLQAVQRRSQFSGAILVGKNDEVVFERGFGRSSFEFNIPNTETTVFRIASVTKNFTAVAILDLCDRGKLSLEDRLTKFIPDFRNGDEIQVQHLLSHTSGIANYTRLPEFPLHGAFDPDEIIETLAARELEFRPGSKFEYSNSGYMILGLIIEKVSGRKYAEYLRTYLFTPLKLENTFVESDSSFIKGLASGYKMAEENVARAKWFYRNGGADGAICSSAKDLFKWYRAHDRILAPVTKESMYRGYRGHSFGCFKAQRFGRILITHSGSAPGAKCQVDLYPDDGVSVIVLSNLAIDYQVSEIARDMAAILFGEPYEVSPLKSAVSTGQDKFHDYVGDYVVSSNKSFSVFVRNAKLYTRFSRHEPNRIYPCGQDRFFYRWQEVELQFLRTDDGEVNGVEFVAPRAKATFTRANR